MAGVSTRLACGVTSYLDFRGDTEGGIVFERFRHRIQALLSKCPILDDSEIDVLARYCHTAVVQREDVIFGPSITTGRCRRLRRWLAKWTGLSGLRKDLGLKRHTTSTSMDERIQRNDFLSAFGVSEPVALNDLAVLFDQDRRVPMVERMFTPSVLYHKIHDAERAVVELDDDSADQKVQIFPTEQETALYSLQERLHASELRHAETDQLLQDWKSWATSMTGKMKHMEDKLLELVLQVAEGPSAQVPSHEPPERLVAEVPAPPTDSPSRIEELNSRVFQLETLVSFMQEQVAPSHQDNGPPQVYNGAGKGPEAITPGTAQTARARNGDAAEGILPLSLPQPKPHGSTLCQRVAHVEQRMDDVSEDLWKLRVFFESPTPQRHRVDGSGASDFSARCSQYA